MSHLSLALVSYDWRRDGWSKDGRGKVLIWVWTADGALNGPLGNYEKQKKVCFSVKKIWFLLEQKSKKN